VHVRDPSLVNLQALPEMARGHLLADFITCVAMLDPILGGVDR
jgi:NADH-quinone oxidoreductase subunit D